MPRPAWLASPWRGNGERPLACVPRAVLVSLLAALACQAAVRAVAPAPEPPSAGLPAPPGIQALRLSSLGDPLPVARLLGLYLQSYDQRAGNPVTYRQFDYAVLTAWLDRILELDPRGQYPLMLASRLYAEVPDEAKQRRMLDFIYRAFLEDPARRWPWLAHATLIAKHQLRDLPLARQYAAAIQRLAPHDVVPQWAREMEAFILEDMNELEAARVMIGGLIARGMVKDPGELHLLEQRLKEIEARLGRLK